MTRSLSLRPREKLQQLGMSSLTTSELVALILGNGTAKSHVDVLADQVITELRNQHISLESLQRIHGIGTAKACQLLAMVEFMERVRPRGYPVMDELQKVIDAVGELRTAQREHIICLYLNTRMQLLIKETLAIGSINQSALSPRDVFSVIKYHPVSFVIFVHNHPSGNPQPSTADLQFTQRMVSAAEVLGIEVLDHVIIGATTHYSLKQHHQLHSTAEKG